METLNNKKLSLSELKVERFITSLDKVKTNTVKGGTTTAFCVVSSQPCAANAVKTVLVVVGTLLAAVVAKADELEEDAGDASDDGDVCMGGTGVDKGSYCCLMQNNKDFFQGEKFDLMAGFLEGEPVVFFNTTNSPRKLALWNY